MEPVPQSSVRSPSDSNVVVACFTVTHLLGLDLLSLSTSQKDDFRVALAVLVSASKVPQSKVFISQALAQTSYIFLTLDRALKFQHGDFLQIGCLKRTEDRV